MTVWVVLSSSLDVVVFEYLEDAVEFVNNAANRAQLRIVKTDIV